ncbi:hypothetical protein J4466_04280 [Candidatus Pacearchaeota archaeon]|nr:hypothetical protein [Candidatus Pacearchaeota archaeon]
MNKNYEFHGPALEGDYIIGLFVTKSFEDTDRKRILEYYHRMNFELAHTSEANGSQVLILKFSPDIVIRDDILGRPIEFMGDLTGAAINALAEYFGFDVRPAVYFKGKTLDEVAQEVAAMDA